jgi:hypothetical protein
MVAGVLVCHEYSVTVTYITVTQWGINAILSSDVRLTRTCVHSIRCYLDLTLPHCGFLRDSMLGSAMTHV